MHTNQVKRPLMSMFTPLLMLALLAEGASAAAGDDPRITVPKAEIV